MATVCVRHDITEVYIKYDNNNLCSCLLPVEMCLRIQTLLSKELNNVNGFFILTTSQKTIMHAVTLLVESKLNK